MLDLVIKVLLGAAALAVLMYLLGWSFSCGYHRAKRTFVTRIMNESLREDG